ncbi:MAG: prolyl oligopeptidase family serine peptidase [Phycisphaerales bacterium]
MDERFSRLPRSLEERTRIVELGETRVPALIAHPDWETPAPCAIWLHGRTAFKELDSGRYLRWIRAGIGACAIDLPGHGQRADGSAEDPSRSLDTLEQLLPEIDQVARALTSGEYARVFDANRLALGGMSLGGMGALRRLCDEHPFACAAVEATSGSLADLYFPKGGAGGAPWTVTHDPERVRRLDPMEHLSGWAPIPLLVLHSETDRMVPWDAQRPFVEALRERYESLGADPGWIEVTTWPETGAPGEHLGFGRFANDAKNIQTEFLGRRLGAQT